MKLKNPNLLSDEQEAVGKTINYIGRSDGNSFHFVFTDGSVLRLQSAVAYEDDTEINVVDVFYFNASLSYWSDDDLVASGVGTMQQIIEFRLDAKKKQQLEFRRLEREKYLELKKRFEGGE